MKYHDHSLAGYSVRQNGGLVILHLTLDGDTSNIEFSGVVLYHFIHTGSAIITDIYETPLLPLIITNHEMLNEWSRQHGELAYWSDDATAYAARLIELGCKAWRVDSAIGFAGFVIAKHVKQKALNDTL